MVCMSEICLTAEGGHGRDAYVQLVHGEHPCSFCGERFDTVVQFDNSYGEYGPHFICAGCIDSVLGSEPDSHNYCATCRRYKTLVYRDGKLFCGDCGRLCGVSPWPR